MSTAQNLPCPAEDIEPHEPHAHATPLSLALDLDEADEQEMEEVYDALHSCPVCLRALETLAYWLTALDHGSPRVGPEFLTRHRQLADLLGQPGSHPQCLDLARSDTIFHQWGLCRLLLEQSGRAGSCAPSYAVELGELALVIAEALDPDFYDAAWVADLRAEAALHLAILHRVQRHFEPAEALFRAALTWWETGTGRRKIPQHLKDPDSLFIRDKGEIVASRVVGERLKVDSSPAAKTALSGPVQQLLLRFSTASGSA